MGQLALSLKENPSKSFPSDTKKNPKQFMAVTLRSRNELQEPKKIENEREKIEKREIEVEEKRVEMKIIKRGLR